MTGSRGEKFSKLEKGIWRIKLCGLYRHSKFRNEKHFLEIAAAPLFCNVAMLSRRLFLRIKHQFEKLYGKGNILSLSLSRSFRS